MRFRAYSVSPEDFDNWVAGQQQSAVFPVVQAPAATPATPVADPPQVPVAGYAFPADQLPTHVIPATPVPAGLTIADDVLAAGDAQRGADLFSRTTCIGCHTVRGTISRGVIGPDLTHIGSRHTIAAGLYPNDPRHMALWLKNARRMKPMQTSSMPTLGVGETDPILETTVSAALGGLTDQQIADLVAYLMSLK
jgi:cytochrome c oxidase subunit 2